MSQDKPPKPKKPLDNFIQYSSLGFEMLVIICVGVWLGIKLDHWLTMSFPLFTLLFMVLSVIGAIYHVIRKFL
jgi:F0F1-type ATP synthase assembly protein I